MRVWRKKFSLRCLSAPCSIVSERKRCVSSLIDSTPHLLEAVLVRRFVRGHGEDSQGGVVMLLYQFASLLAWQYDRKWCVGSWRETAESFVTCLCVLAGVEMT